MKNKIILPLTVFIFLLTSKVFSQKFYFSINTGYGIPIGANNYYSSNRTTNISGSSTTNTHERIKGSGSFGKGLQFGGSIGYKVHPVVSIELGLTYLMGNTLNYSITEITPTSSTISTGTASGRMFRLTPAVMLSTNNVKTNLYVRMGMVFGLGSRLNTTDKSNYSSSGSSQLTQQAALFSGGIALGFSGATGVKVKLNNTINIFGELNIITQSWAPSKSVLTQYTENGTNKLPIMDTYNKETIFVDSYTFSSTNIDRGSPRKQLNSYFPFSSVGFNIGLIYNLNGASK